jgi:hypothetical protein
MRALHLHGARASLMKRNRYVLALGAGFAILSSVTLALSAAKPDADKIARTPVIVELFTSEGCSSCPPAEALLSRLQAEQPIQGTEIIPIEEHVDYWDQQGWRDPFSSPGWTERQRNYAGVLGDHGVYTPEMVVDGMTGFVGSHAKQSRDSIQAAANLKKASIVIAVLPGENSHRVEFEVHVGGLAGVAQVKDSPEVWLAVTEAGLHSAVRAGENNGRELHHAPVLRKLQHLGAADSRKEPSFAATARVALDRDWITGNLTLVVFVQEKRSRRILGAASETLRFSR